MACRDKGISCDKKYTTLLDLARQAKVLSGETACFEGGIQVGIPFSGYPSGVDYASVVSLGIVDSQVTLLNTTSATGTTFFDVSNPNSIYYDANFSGYSYECIFDGLVGSTCYGTTGYTKCTFTGNIEDNCDGQTGFTENLNYAWTNPLFSASTSGMTLPITNLSANTQTVGPFWTQTQTGCTGDHIIATQYTGYTIQYSFFDIFPYLTTQSGCVTTGSSGDTCDGVTGFTSIITGQTIAFSGFTNATQENFSASTIDYRGPLTYLHSLEDALIDNRLTTKKLRVTGGASASTIGYVLTQVDEIGSAEWVFNSSSASTNTFVTSGLLNGSDELELTYNTGGSVPPIDLSSLSGDTWTLQSVLNEGSSPAVPPWTSTDSVGLLSGDTIVIGTGDIFGGPPTGPASAMILNHTQGTVYLSGAFDLSGDSDHGAIKMTAQNDHGISTIDVSGEEIDINTTGSTILLEADGNIKIDGTGELTNPSVGDVLSAKDSSGRLKWETPYSFTGGTGSCITDLYITNRYGCSTITEHDSIQHVGSSATGINSIAWGTGTTASGDYSHAEGKSNEAVGEYSHVEGLASGAYGGISHAEGFNTIASGTSSHSEGFTTIASGEYSHAEGQLTEASGVASHAEGFSTVASGDFSHAGGVGLDSNNKVIASGGTSFVHFEQTIPGGFVGAYGDNSAILGGTDHNIRSGSTSSGIFGGTHNTIEVDIINSSIIGGGENLIEIVTSGACGCPCDYVYDEVSEACSQYSGSTSGSGPTISAILLEDSYGNRGGRFCIADSYPTGAGTGCDDGGATQTDIHFRVTGLPFWGSGVPAATDGRLNEVGVFNTSMLSTTDWYGFSTCINAPSEGVYLFGLAADNYIRASLGGMLLLDTQVDTLSEENDNFRYWWVWPVNLIAGSIPLILEGANISGQAGFGCEIVGPFGAGDFANTDDFHIFTGQTGIDLWTANTIFSSASMVGGTFNTETNQCPDGYEWDSCTNSCLKSVACSPIITSASIIGGCSNTITNSAQFATILGGSQNVIDGGIGTTILGGQNITGTSLNTTYVPNLNINLQPSEDNSLIQLLVRDDSDGTIKYRDPGSIAGAFSGNTSGECIGDLWVSNLHGCSPITIGTSIQSPGSTASGIGSIAYGFETIASGEYSHAEGKSTTATGSTAHAEGEDTMAYGEDSHAEGKGTTASGEQSHAEGGITQAIGGSSHAEGAVTVAFGDASHSEGEETQAMGRASHAEGFLTVASGDYSHAGGDGSSAVGIGSYAHGQNTVANGEYSTAYGNKSIVNGNYASIIGGTNNTIGDNFTGSTYSSENYTITFNQISDNSVDIDYISTSGLTAYKIVLDEFGNIGDTLPIITAATTTSVISSVSFGDNTVVGIGSAAGSISPGSGTLVTLEFASNIEEFFPSSGTGNILSLGRFVGDTILTGGTGNGGDLNNSGGAYSMLDIIPMVNGLIANDRFGGASAEAWNISGGTANAAGNMSGADGVENLYGLMWLILNSVTPAPPPIDGFSVFEDISNPLSNNSVILGGENNRISAGATRSVILGGINITATTQDTVYAPNLDLSEFGGVLYTQTISGSPVTIGSEVNIDGPLTVEGDTTFNDGTEFNSGADYAQGEFKMGVNGRFSYGEWIDSQGETTIDSRFKNLIKLTPPRVPAPWTVTQIHHDTEGQILTLLADPTMGVAVTIQDNVNTNLNGTADFVMNAGDTLTLISSDSLNTWYEIARMVR